MAKRAYCDPHQLESTWWSWILAQRTPDLQDVRESDLLWTLDHGDGRMEHFVASSDPYSFASKKEGDTKEDPYLIPQGDFSAAMKSSFRPFDPALARQLIAKNYHLEQSPDVTWPILAKMIYLICEGISLNFHPPNEDVKNELIHNACTQTLNKIQRRKLEFTRGQAPPFNLLTTAIFRIMYSIKNKEKRDREHRSKLTNDLVKGTLLPNLNSLNVSKSLVGPCH